jgi:F0F1-type ATP synthase beta subunit
MARGRTSRRRAHLFQPRTGETKYLACCGSHSVKIALLESGVVSEEHKQMARQVRALLQRYASSQVAAEADQQKVKRAQRL